MHRALQFFIEIVPNNLEISGEQSGQFRSQRFGNLHELARITVLDDSDSKEREKIRQDRGP